MSHYKIKAEFEVGDLVHLEAYNIDIYTNDNKFLLNFVTSESPHVLQVVSVSSGATSCNTKATF